MALCAGTYCGKLADALGIAHIATGDLVRDEIDRRTDIGLQVRLSAASSCSCEVPALRRAALSQAQANVMSGNLLPDSTILHVRLCSLAGTYTSRFLPS